MRKRLFIAVLLFCFLFGCQNEDLPAVEEIMETEPGPAPFAQEAGAGEFDGITISIGMDGFFSADDAVAKIIEEKLGIRLAPVDLSEYNENLLAYKAESGALPDILRVDISRPYFADWIEKGIIRSWPAEQMGALARLRAAGSGELRALNRWYREGIWFIPAEEIFTADSGRIYYRRDWAETLQIEPPETTEQFLAMIKAFSENNLHNRQSYGITLSGGVSYLISLFGTDPESWIWDEGEEWIPAFYSDKMLAGLHWVRELYENKWLDLEYPVNRAATAVHKFADGEAGILIRHGDAFWFNRIISSFAASQRVSAREAFNYIAVLPPPAFENEEVRSSHWPRSVVTRGLALSAYADEEKLDAIYSLLEYILSDESGEIAYFGIEGETSAKDAGGVTRLFVDPETAKPFEITRKYPSAHVLFLMGRSPLCVGDVSVPSELPPELKTALLDAAAAYDKAALYEGGGFDIRFLRTPAKNAFESAIAYGAAFNAIVTGQEPVDEMFAAFKLECEEKGIQSVISEVNERMGVIRSDMAEDDTAFE